MAYKEYLKNISEWAGRGYEAAASLPPRIRKMEQIGRR